jgi:hypothetical protein
MCAEVSRSMSVMMVEVLLDVMRDQLIDFVGGYKECGCLLKERDARERFASMSSDDRKNKNSRLTRVSLMIYSCRPSTQRILRQVGIILGKRALAPSTPSGRERPGSRIRLTGTRRGQGYCRALTGIL